MPCSSLLILYLLQNKDMYGIRVKYVAVAEETSDSENYTAIKDSIGKSQEKLVENSEGEPEDKSMESSIEENIRMPERESKDESMEKSIDKPEKNFLEQSVEKVRQKFMERFTEQYEKDSMERLVKQSTETELIEIGKDMVIDGHFRVLYPGKDRVSEIKTDVKENIKGNTNGNDYSLVMDFCDKNIEVLFTGDISQDVERYLLDEVKSLERSGKRILKCPHHGSKYSSSQEFLEAYSPDMTVISCARKNRYGHPSPETLDRLENQNIHIFRTDREGAIIIQY